MWYHRDIEGKSWERNTGPTCGPVYSGEKLYYKEGIRQIQKVGLEMNINSTPDETYICTHCEADVDDYHGSLAFHLDLGYGDTYTVCSTCAKNLVN